MKKAVLTVFAAVLCLSAFSDESWSEGFFFDGSEITQKAIVLHPEDQIAYSTDLADGYPISITIEVEDTSDASIGATLFEDYSGGSVEGTIQWDYKDQAYKDFPTDDTYLLTENIMTGTETLNLKRKVTLLPEPFCWLFLAFAGALFLRKRAKSLLAVLALAFLFSFSAQADGCVGKVSCLQMWPFSRSVVINYTLASETEDPFFEIKFYGSIDDGETVFDLSQRGSLEKDGAGGIVEGSGLHKTIWIPSDHFFFTKTKNMKVKVVAEETEKPGGDYMVVDLTDGALSYLDEVPEGGWTEEYKTTKMVLKKIEPGKFNMGSPESEAWRNGDETQHEVTLTRPFYAGVFEVTQKQYETIAGTNPAEYKGDTRPVECVSYDMLRGTGEGLQWPNNSEVDADSFFGKLRAKTGMKFDLPTEAQWEYAGRAGTTTSLNNGQDLEDFMEDSNLAKLGRYWFNGGSEKDEEGIYAAHVTVGSYEPNAWGLYDAHGNVLEWCLDWYGLYKGDATDPKGAKAGDYELGDFRVLKGGNWGNFAYNCRSAVRFNSRSSNADGSCGFRVFLVR